MRNPRRNRDYAADEAVLREQSLPTDGRGLVDIFRSRIPSPATIAQFKKHVAGLRASANRRPVSKQTPT